MPKMRQHCLIMPPPPAAQPSLLLAITILPLSCELFDCCVVLPSSNLPPPSFLYCRVFLLLPPSIAARRHLSPTATTAILLPLLCTVRLLCFLFVIVVVVVAVIIDAFSKMHSSDQQQTISHKVIFVQVTANVIYALAFSAFAILFTIFPWVWYVKLFFEFFSSFFI